MGHGESLYFSIFIRIFFFKKSCNIYKFIWYKIFLLKFYHWIVINVQEIISSDKKLWTGRLLIRTVNESCIVHAAKFRTRYSHGNQWNASGILRAYWWLFRELRMPVPAASLFQRRRYSASDWEMSFSFPLYSFHSFIIFISLPSLSRETNKQVYSRVADSRVYLN